MKTKQWMKKQIMPSHYEWMQRCKELDLCKNIMPRWLCPLIKSQLTLSSSQQNQSHAIACIYRATTCVLQLSVLCTG